MQAFKMKPLLAALKSAALNSINLNGIVDATCIIFTSNRTCIVKNKRILDGG